MTRSSRFLNRLFLALVGLGAIGAAVLAALPALRVELPVRLPDLSSPLVLWILAAACAIVAILALAWILTRGRGRSGSALRTAEVDIDTRVVTQLLQDSLAGTPDVLSVDASAFVRRRARLVRITVQTRRHPDLVVLRDRIRTAVDRLDTAIGAPLPLVVHITTGVRTALAGARTTH
jgi:hypothetical protein